MKNVKGITLITLVLTIIILIILAGVAINLSIGENGLFSRAKYAKEDYLNAQEKEQQELNDLYSQILIATNDSSQVTVSVEDLRKIIAEEIKNAGATTNPTGTVISYMGNTAPTGYLFCDGKTYNISDYPNLAEQIKEQFGSYNYYGGNGTTTFAVPDLRGEFLRGTGTATRNTGTGVEVGVHQEATSLPYLWVHSNGNLYYPSDSTFPTNIDIDISEYGTGHFFSSGQVLNTGYTQAVYFTSRPTNTSVLYCIKY